MDSLTVIDSTVQMWREETGHERTVPNGAKEDVQEVDGIGKIKYMDREH
jgi:hypothetical protein